MTEVEAWFLPALEGVQDPGPSERVDQISSRLSCYVEGGVTTVPLRACSLREVIFSSSAWTLVMMAGVKIQSTSLMVLNESRIQVP